LSAEGWQQVARFLPFGKKGRFFRRSEKMRRQTTAFELSTFTFLRAIAEKVQSLSEIHPA